MEARRIMSTTMNMDFIVFIVQPFAFKARIACFLVHVQYFHDNSNTGAPTNRARPAIPDVRVWRLSRMVFPSNRHGRKDTFCLQVPPEQPCACHSHHFGGYHTWLLVMAFTPEVPIHNVSDMSPPGRSFSIRCLLKSPP